MTIVYYFALKNLDLELPQRYYFSKTDKLKSRKAIDLIFTKGKSFSNLPFKVLWLQAANQPVLQVAVGVSSRNFKRAVDRNRVKRLMREAWRLQKHELHTRLTASSRTLSVFILYTGKELPDYKLVFEKFTIILQRLSKLAHENIEAGS